MKSKLWYVDKDRDLDARQLALAPSTSFEAPYFDWTADRGQRDIAARELADVLVKRQGRPVGDL